MRSAAYSTGLSPYKRVVFLGLGSSVVEGEMGVEAEAEASTEAMVETTIEA